MGAQGTATLDFGVFPGATDASIAVTGLSGILAGSLVEAWIVPAATADHTADEHWVENFEVFAGNIVAGTGFTIYGICRDPIMEPSLPDKGAVGVGRQQSQESVAQDLGGKVPRISGRWNIGWVWN